MPPTPDPEAPDPGTDAADRPGRLFLVATPIGNLRDITLRALDVLEAVDLVLAEDTRRTRKLLAHFDLHKPLESLHEHNETAKAAGLVERLRGGQSMALVSDAGTPLLSDPGYPLVTAALEAGVDAVPVPGASAVLASLVASGLPPDRFTFVGYLPRKATGRRRELEALAGIPGTLIFLESPRRLVAMLSDAADVLGPRHATVARELTKVHEEFLRGPLPELGRRLEGREIRGEVTVCVTGAPDPGAAEGREVASARDLVDHYERLLDEDVERNEALRAVAERFGMSRNDVYDLVVIGRDDDDAED